MGWFQKLNNMEKISLQLDFKPASQFKYYNLIMVAGVVLISGIILLLGLAFEFFIFEGFEINVTALLIAVIAIVVLIVALWNELYYKSIVYNLNNTEMTWKRGVWFRQTGIVPYSRITNVDIAQGPLMRL
ncbi:MAG: PH domain-containing protein, partial [Methanomicrobium sp.]|nr:PH domain-containing protein [Methanomicrobium sp.]